MSNNASEQTPWGCIGAVLAAIILAAATIVVALPILVPFFSEPTATPSTKVALEEPEEVTLHNQLYRPVSIYIDSIYQGWIEARSSERFLLFQVPATIEFRVDRREDDESGKPYGVAFNAFFYQVMGDNQNLYIDNQVGEEVYFYPVINNQTDQNCDIVINEGTAWEDKIGYAPAHSQGIVSGYFELKPKSSVVLYCGSERARWYWGSPPDSETTALSKYVDESSGYVELTISP